MDISRHQCVQEERVQAHRRQEKCPIDCAAQASAVRRRQHKAQTNNYLFGRALGTATLEQRERTVCDVHLEEPPFWLQQDQLDTHHQQVVSHTANLRNGRCKARCDLHQPREQETANQLR